MNKNELLRKINWTRTDIASYFNITAAQVQYAIKKGNIKPLAINRKMFAINDVLTAFGTSLEREMQNCK